VFSQPEPPRASRQRRRGLWSRELEVNMSSDIPPQRRVEPATLYPTAALAAAVLACLSILLLIVLLHPSSVAVDSVYGGF
jgi:hypothetical protein